ncbi:MAG: lipoyl(octanoyl) transferase LipB [Anaerohalosphaera sp.]|nr:lipoyl(octanoyl) transferase LipB [Anaerohalosphaera sp.]
MFSNQKRQVKIEDHELMAYSQSLQLQHEMVANRQSGSACNTVILVEHYPVVTLGANKNENKLLENADFYAKNGITVEHIRRGGGTTAHNPGQIVIYPVVNIQSLGLGVSEYIRDLESIGIELLDLLEIKGHRRQGVPGLWVEGRKIGSIGVKIKRWVTYHGMAINIYNDLSIFDTMIPCGIEGVEMTSVLKETGRKIDIKEVKQMLNRIIISHWG